MATSKRDPISELFDVAAIEKNVARVESLVTDVQKKLLAIQPVDLAGGANSLKEFNRQSKEYATTLQQISASTKQVLDAEKLAAAERRRIADERTQQAKIARAELQLQQAEIKKKALEEKQAAAEEKKAAAEAVAAGRERIIQLKQEQAEQEKLRAAAESRASAEQAALSGTYNPGGNNKQVANTPVFLSPKEKDILIIKSYEQEIARLTTEINASKVAFKNGEISQSAYAKVVARNTIDIIQAKNALADRNKALQLSQKAEDAERNSISRAQALIAQYTFAKSKLNTSTAEGARLNDNYNKAIEKTNAFILKNADAETVRTKGIGEYTKGINKAFGALRTIANILPGVGIGTIFLAGFEALKLLVEEMGVFNSKVFDYKKQQEAILELNQKTAESAGKEAGQLKIVRAEIESATVPMKTRVQLIKDLREQYPDYFTGLSNEQLLTGKVGDAYDKAADAIIRKARANAAAAKIEELSSKQLELDLKLLKDVEDTNKKIAEAKGGTDIVFGGNQFGTSTGGIEVTKQQRQKALKDDFDARKKANKDEKQLLQEQLDFYLKFAVEGADAVVKIQKDKSEKTKAASKESTVELFSADFEETKRQLQRRANLFNEAANDENKTYDERIQALQNYLDTIDKLNRFQYQKDLQDEQKKLAIQQGNAAKAKGTDKINQLKEVENTQQRIKDLENKLYNQRLDLADQFTKRQLEIFKSAEEQEARRRKEQYDAELADAAASNTDKKAAISAEYAARLDALNENFLKEKITRKQFNDEREKLDFDYQTTVLRNELAFAKQVLEIQKKYGLDTQKQQEDIQKLASDLEIIIAKRQIDAKEKELAREEEYAKKKKDLYKELYKEIGQTIFQFLDDSLKREEQDLDERKRLLDEDTQRRINNVNQLGLVESERVKQTAAIEKDAQFQTEQIEKRKRAIAVERAKFEKAANIANIIQSTAVAVINQLGAKPPGPQNFVLAALIGSIGALQLARAISTPLPKYFKGTESAKQGLGVFGEIGRELVIPKQGQPYLSPAVASIHNFLGGEKIIPADKTAMLLNSLSRTPGMNNKNEIIPLTELIQAQNKTTKAVENLRLSVFVQNNSNVETQAWFIKAFKN